MDDTRTFSERHGFTVPDAPISMRNEAPAWLREFVTRLAYEAELNPSKLRDVLCEILLEAPDRNNWSEFPNIDSEARQLLTRLEWFQVYDFIEKIAGCIHPMRYNPMTAGQNPALDNFTEKLNLAFRRRGIGWQLIDCRIEVRGEESFETSVRTAITVTQQTGRSVAEHELHEALHDLSKRPVPDITGAIQHAMAALECTARDVTGNQKPTLGELVKKHPDLFPAPLDQAVEKLWGFTSEQGRHLREGQVPKVEVAELVVGLAGALVTYLVRKS